MNALNSVVRKLMGLHRDTGACECIEFGGGEIGKVT